MADFAVERLMGVVGEVTVYWKVQPNDTGDVTPTNGTLVFKHGETMVSCLRAPTSG